MLKTKRTMMLSALVLALITLALPAFGMDRGGINMPQGVTEFSAEVYRLHMIIFWICVAIGVVVFGAIFWSILRYRKSKGAVAAQFSHSTPAEVIWTIVPCLILIAMAWPATKTLILMEDMKGADMTVKITGYQWKWRYDYVDEEISILSTLTAEANAARQVGSGIDPNTVDNYLLDVDNRLVLPTNTRVRFLLTADDVIHSWWVPELGWKRDAIPGFINEAWTNITVPGVYRGQCTELCGKDHGFMPIVLEAMEPADYEAWLVSQRAEMASVEADNQRQWAMDELMARGETVYLQQCSTCHQMDGQGLDPQFPALAGSAVAQGPVDAHLELILNGRSGTAMQGFGELLSERDIAAALTFTRNAFGNDTGDTVQPSDVVSYKNG